jgi:2'-5' RNA ligase
MPDSIRAFVAISLPDDLIDRIGTLQNDLKAEGLAFRWVNPRNIHLTLKFLGDIPPARVPDIRQSLTEAAAEHSVFELMAKGIGVFPGLKKPRVIWAGVGGQVEKLRNLQHSVEAHLADLGFAPEKRRFKSHLTMGRSKGFVDPDHLLAALQQHGRFASKPFWVDRLALYRSRLDPTGAVYTQLVQVPIGDSE